MKRIFSKKSGFTLVEIIVAFAIFAIMAGMLLSMVRLTVAARSENAVMASEIDIQSEYLAKHYYFEDEYGADGETAYGTFNLKFTDTNCDVSMDYGIRTSPSLDGTFAGGEIDPNGINYFVTGLESAPPGGNESDPNVPAIPGQKSGQTGRFDTRITGSKGIDQIKIVSVEKTTAPNGNVRYIFKTVADGQIAPAGSVSADLAPYMQYKLRFCYADAFTYSEPDADGYKYKVYNEAEIIECGYVESGSYKKSNAFTPSDTSDNAYTVEKTSDSTIRIGVPISTDAKGLQPWKFSTFYVDFKDDPGLTAASFGANGDVQADGSVIYTAFPQYDAKDNVLVGKYYPNIYGASLVEKTKAD